MEIKDKKTETFYPVEEKEYIAGFDYITVSACRTAPWDFDKSGWGNLIKKDERFLKESKGNQYRFINHSMRQLTQFPNAELNDPSIQLLHIVFEQGYTFNDIERINEYSKALNAKTIYIKDVDALITFLNRRKSSKRIIKELVFFAHGLVSTITFHYQGKNVGGGLFGKGDVSRIEEEIFSYDAEVTTYGCRNGISIDAGDFTDTNGEAGQKESLAQEMADDWLVKVWAYEMRSGYDFSYGTGDEITEAETYAPVIEKYENDMYRYDELISQGVDAIKPKKPPNYDKMVIRHEDWKTRENNKSDGGGPIMPRGAWHDVGNGSTPTGLKRDLQPYIPQEWQCEL